MNLRITFAILLLVSKFLIAETITISTVEGLPLSDICSHIIEKVYEKAGYELKIIPMPPARATFEVTTGRIDGETHRIGSYGEDHPSLIQVPFSYYSIQVVLYTNMDNPARYASIEDLPLYRYAILRGIKNSKDLTAEFPNVQEVDDSLTMFKLLLLNRTDFAVTSNIFGDAFLHKNGIEGITTHQIPLQNTDLYHYLHIDHADIVPIIYRTMRDMAASGELDLIIKEAERLILESL